MRNAFNELSDTARIWIYQGSRKMSDSEAGFVRAETRKFINNWQAHGQPLKADTSVIKNQFLVIAADESSTLASGCSIDSSVGLVRDMGETLNVDFLDRTKVAFFIDDQVKIYQLNEIKELVEQGEIKPETLVFDNMVKTLGEWKSSWLIPSSESWLKKYFR